MKSTSALFITLFLFVLCVNGQKKTKLEQQIMEAERIPVFLEVQNITFWPEDFSDQVVAVDANDYQFILTSYIDLLNEAFGRELFVLGDWDDVPQVDDGIGGLKNDWRASDLDLATRISMNIFYDATANIKSPGVLNDPPYTYKQLVTMIVSFNDIDRPMNVRNFAVRIIGDTSGEYEYVPELDLLIEEFSPAKVIKSSLDPFGTKSVSFYQRIRKKYDKLTK